MKPLKLTLAYLALLALDVSLWLVGEKWEELRHSSRLEIQVKDDLL